jgi:Phage terminase, small subunit.
MSDILPAPPSHLAKASQTLFLDLAEAYNLTGRDVELLITGLEAKDRASQARRELKRSGLTVTNTKGAVVAHPLVGVEKAAQRVWISVLKTLHEPHTPHVKRGGGTPYGTGRSAILKAAV